RKCTTTIVSHTCTIRLTRHQRLLPSCTANRRDRHSFPTRRSSDLDTLKVKIISVTFRRVIRTNHKKASKIWRHENIQLGGKECRSEERFSRNAETDIVCRLLLEKKKQYITELLPQEWISCMHS